MKIYLSLAIHNHQPVGNFGWVFERAYRQAYLPMADALRRHPTIRVALHYSGPLRDWLLENAPDFFPLVRELVKSGQVEIMTGAYYEPVLVALPDEDKFGQIRKQTEAVREDFGCDPTGFWLAERIWEPHLPSILAQAGVQYAIVDDTHFKAVGYTDEDLLGYYVTEDQGHALKVFGSSMPLRYAIPFHTVESIIAWLRSQYETETGIGRYVGRGRVAVMGDDGEKFGIWPGTYDHCWERGWMEEFFTALEENSDWVETIPPGEVARDFPSLGRIHLPTSSYEEMGEWALPPNAAWELSHLKHQLRDEGRDDVVRYMSGGFWRHFMVKYEEVNQLHKKALWVSRKVHAMRPSRRKQQALDHLWAGQCNCGYWHGLFGGIYLFHIRVADYDHLIAAENIADGLDQPTPQSFVRAEVLDFDRDAHDDVVLTSDVQSLVFNLASGGTLVEWDYRFARYNLLNVMTRRREGFHRDLVEATQEGRVVTPEMEREATKKGEPETIHTRVVRARELDLPERLFDDWYRRAALIDHFLGEDVTLDAFYRCQYTELGDFVNQPYVQAIHQMSETALRLALRRDGNVWQGAVLLPVTVEKAILLRSSDATLTISYRVTNGESGDLNTRFGIEMSWGLADGEASHSYLGLGFGRYALTEISANDEVCDFEITSELWGINIKVDTSSPATLWRFPLETISASEVGFERNYQGTTTLLWWPVHLASGQSWRVELTFRLRRLRA